MSPLFIGVGFFILAAVGSMTAGFILTRREGELTDRLEDVTAVTEVSDALREEGRPKEERFFSRLAEGLDKRLSRRGLGARISAQLAQANMRLTVTEYLIINVLCVVAAFGVGTLMLGSWVLAIFVGIGGFFLPRLYVGLAKRQRLHKFDDQLGDTINLLVNGLRSGYSMLQAMEAVARELPPPVCEEFARVVQEVGLGLTAEQALNNMLRRIPSEDLDLMVTAINVQHEVGGNLAEILDIISYTIRERVRIKGEIRVLTAQGMISGYIITFLPIILSLVLFMMNRTYLMRMVENICGWIMIGVAASGIVIGFIAIQKIVQIEV